MRVRVQRLHCCGVSQAGTRPPLDGCNACLLPQRRHRARRAQREHVRQTALRCAGLCGCRGADDEDQTVTLHGCTGAGVQGCTGAWCRGAMSATGAITVLRKQGVAFTEHEYRYEERGGTAVSSRELGVDEHSVIKTLGLEEGKQKTRVS